MRIGIFLQDLKSGGAEKIMVGFANYVANNPGDEVFLILVRNEGPYLQLVSDKVNIIDLNKKKTLYAFGSLYKQIKKLKIEILYSTLVNANILALLVSKIVSCKVIIREANTIQLLHEKEKRKLIRIANFLTGYLYNWCYKCIAISKSVKTDLVKFTNCREDKIQVIYNPIMVKDDVEASLDKSFFHVGMVSRLTTQKNIPTICKVIDTLLAKGLKIQFHFFGEGDATGVMELKSKYNEDSIILHGFEISYYSYVKQMDIFIHIPLWEGLGNSVLEIYTSGIPMILSNVQSGFSELIAKDEVNVHYIDPFDAAGAANIVENYYNKNFKVIEGRKKLNLYPHEIYDAYRTLAG